MKNDNLDNIWKLLEHQEKEMFYEYHKDMEARKAIIQRAMNKIDVLKILGENLRESIILLGDIVSLEIDYGDNDLEIITQKIVISSDNLDELSLYSPIGSAVFAQNVGETLTVQLPNGEIASVRILAKNKDLLEEEQTNNLNK